MWLPIWKLVYMLGGWNMQTDRYVCLPHYAFVLYTLWNKYTKEYVLQSFLLHIWFIVCFMCRVRSLPQCLQPATFPVSMMVMVSTSGPHVQRKMVGTTYLSDSLMVWPGHCHSPETCVFVIHHFYVESLSSHVFHSWTCFMIHILEWQFYSSAWYDGWSGLSLCRINILEEFLLLLCAYVKNVLYYASLNYTHLVILIYT